jgi:hypothetical protein
MVENSEIFTTLQLSVEARARHTSAIDAEAGKQRRHERVRQGPSRPLGNYSRPEGRPASLNWCTVYGSEGHNTVVCRQAQAAHAQANVAEIYAEAAHPESVNDLPLYTTSPAVVDSGAVVAHSASPQLTLECPQA